MPVTVKIEGVSRLLDNLRDLEKRQIPFILAKSLTDTAKDAQKASQQSLTERSAFTLRNKWTEGGIRIKPALKSSAGGRIEADVHTDLAKGGGVDYLQIQDSDYVRAPTGHHYLCIPTDILRRMAGGKSAIIPDELRPANLLRYADGKFKYAVTRGKMKGTLRRVRSPAVRGMVFFYRQRRDADPPQERCSRYLGKDNRRSPPGLLAVRHGGAYQEHTQAFLPRRRSERGRRGELCPQLGKELE